MYCEHCSRIVDRGKCLSCGRWPVRLPWPEDYCFLSEPEPIWVQALADLLTDNGIEYIAKRLHGSAMMCKTGIPQRVRFFVPYRQYPQAKELEAAFFSGEFEGFGEETE